MLKFVAGLLVLFFPLTSASAQSAGADHDIEAALADARNTLKVPGMAVAIVRGDETIVARGFGAKDVQTGEAVTGETLFQIGSTTKAFTALGLEMLAERGGGFSLRSKVKDFLPDFAIADPIATRLATPIDLLAHRVGLPRHDLVWYGSPENRDGIFARLKYLQSNYEFRDKWQYK